MSSPTLDAIEELQTNAQYGGVWEFPRTDVLNAQSYFNQVGLFYVGSTAKTRKLEDGMSEKEGSGGSVADFGRRKFLHLTAILAAGVAVSPAFDLGPSVDPSSGEAPIAHESGEWTFERAQRLWQPMTRAIQHVGVPGHQWQGGVFWDGSLLFGPLAYRDSPALEKAYTPLGPNLLNLSIGYGKRRQFLERPGIGDRRVRRSLEEGRLPLPHIETSDGDLIWSETVFAHLLDRRLEEGMNPLPDDVLVVQAKFRVRNSGRVPAIGHLWLHFGDTTDVAFGYKAGRGDELGQALPHHFEAPFGILENNWFEKPFGTLKNDVRYVIPKPGQGELLWHDEVPPPQGMKNPARNIIEWRVPLAAGEETDLWVLIPFGLVDRTTAAKISGLDSNALWSETQRFWKSVVGVPAGTITTTDNFVNDYLAGVAGQMAEQIAYRHVDHVWMYKTSPNFYEVYWPVSAAWALPALDLRGLTQYSRPVLQSFIDTQTEDIGRLTRNPLGGQGVPEQGGGALVPTEGFEKRPGFMGNFGDWTANTLLLSHGLELWALASHYRITRDDRWLRKGAHSPLQAIVEGCDWILTQRRRTMREENGRRVPHWGLLPAASTHDWLSGNTICNDSTCIYGMIESVRLLREIGYPQAEEIARGLNEYRACLRERYQVARDRARPVPMPDGTEIPYVPRDVYELDWSETDWTYTGYGPARAGAWGALDPHDELVDQTLAFLDAGLPKNQGYYLELSHDQFAHPNADENFREISDTRASRHFFSRHYVEYETMVPIFSDLFLQRDDLSRFFEWLFNNLAVAIHKDFRVGVESIDGAPSCAPGDGARWLAIRNMFVNERGGYNGSQQSLWLLQAIPRSWLQPGSTLATGRMGTHFGGHVDLDAHVANGGNSIEVTANLDLTVQPAEIRMRLRSCDGRPLRSALIDGTEVPVTDLDTIKLPSQGKGRYRVVGSYK
jgi:hypothetical protein